MTDVVLVNPRSCSRRSVRLPLSLLHLAAALEGRFSYEIVDGNLDPDATGRVLAALGKGACRAVGVSVMPGPQVAPAVRLSAAVRAAFPQVPILWGGYFPTLYPEAAINAPYVDYLVRGQGEDTLLELLERLPEAGPPAGPAESAAEPGAVRGVAGVTWKREGAVQHNPDRRFRTPDSLPPLPYHRIGDPTPYLRPSFMGRRTGVHQAAIGCRFHCEFCGVVSMFNGVTRLQGGARLRDALVTQRDRFGVTAMQFYDNNFFDTEEATRPLLEVLADLRMPWWCYARADALAKAPPATWELIRRSRLRMAYIGAEAASDSVLAGMRKGSRVEHTVAAARLCRENGVVPELSFILGGPTDPLGEIEKTFAFIKKLKAVHPECEVILYFYSPTPQRDRGPGSTRVEGPLLPKLETYGPSGPALPTTPEEWTEKRWVDYVCHRDAPWLTPRIRRRVRDFATVLGCRYPTVQDPRLPPWGRSLLRGLARWRYGTGCYRYPWELRAARELLALRKPQRESI